jgi:alpha-beta hydrolase superfamily lysophospholipase
MPPLRPFVPRPRAILRLGGWLLLAAGAVWLTVAAGFATQAWWRLPDLSAWHTIGLTHEFRADQPDAPASFDAYLAREALLFDEVDRRIYRDPQAAGRDPYGRYTPGSPGARLALDPAGNRSAVLPAAAPQGAVLLVHGLSDAPYMMRSIGEALRERGLTVVTLRLPGHGTVPGALTGVDREDWSAAVALAARHAAGLAGDGRPFYIAGYSTGAALAVLHALRAIDDPTLAMPTRLFLFAPAIGISSAAAIARVAADLAVVPGLEKARWLDVLPEYDPYKYNSFPVNAARQIWGLTRELDRRLRAAQAAGTLARLPRITAFQSMVDATVRAADLGSRLFGRLPAAGHELVVFDVNRRDFLSGLIAPEPMRAFLAMTAAPALPFRLSVVGNRIPESAEVVERIREPGQAGAAVVDLGLRWPAGVVSLGHLALTLPMDDPIYGLTPAPRPGERAFTLGGSAPSGEGGSLLMPLGDLARLRSNPFFPVIVERLQSALRADLARPGPGGARP